MIRLDDNASGELSIREWSSLFSGKYFAMIVVYADETGTHGLKKGDKEPAPGLYGFMATPEFWETFRQEWLAWLKKYDAPYFHFRELHPKERTKRGNPYFGWNNERVDDFIHDMAILASSGAIPFGGNISLKRTYGNLVTPKAYESAYKKAFQMFFKDFSSSMSDHFHGFKDKVLFFFDENKNDAWIAILSKVIKAKQEKDPRIGEWAFIKSGEYRGIPCQAADLLAFVHRQHMQTVYEKGQHQPSRILDFIISKNAYPKNHLGSRLAKIPMGEWRDLIKALREDRKVKDIACDILGQPRQPYYPASHQLVKQIYNK